MANKKIHLRPSEALLGYLVTDQASLSLHRVLDLPWQMLRDFYAENNRRQAVEALIEVIERRRKGNELPDVDLLRQKIRREQKPSGNYVRWFLWCARRLGARIRNRVSPRIDDAVGLHLLLSLRRLLRMLDSSEQPDSDVILNLRSDICGAMYPFLYSSPLFGRWKKADGVEHFYSSLHHTHYEIDEIIRENFPRWKPD